MPILNSCCCCFSTRTGTLIMGIMSLVSSLLGTIGAIVMITSWDYFAKAVRNNPPPEIDVEEFLSFVKSAAIGILVVCIVLTIISAMLIHGVRTMRPALLLPYIVVSVIITILAIVFNVYLIIDGRRTVVGIINIVFSILSTIYVVLVVYSHYQELRNREGRMSVPTDSKF